MRECANVEMSAKWEFLNEIVCRIRQFDFLKRF